MKPVVDRLEVFFDAQGQEVFRTVGTLDVNQITILLADQQ